MNVYSRTPSVVDNRNLAQTGLREKKRLLTYLGSLVQLASGIGAEMLFSGLSIPPAFTSASVSVWINSLGYC